MNLCHFCRAASPLTVRLDFGDQPIGSHFLTDPAQKAPAHPLTIAQCDRCGLVQIPNPAPVAMLTPPHDWITYNEPEDHLDALVDILAGLPGVTETSSICGISYKDDTTIQRLTARGFHNTRVLDPARDLGLPAGSGLECIQAALDGDAARRIAGRHGKARIVIARHILEHAHDAGRFLSAMAQLADPAGLVVFEVPDSAGAFQSLDYSVLWEDHVRYFTPATFHNSLSGHGWSSVRCDIYPYTLENAIVGIFRPTCHDRSEAVTARELKEEISRFQRYASRFPAVREKIRRRLARGDSRGGPTAVLGAGHLAGTWINIMGLDKYIDMVVDDHPKKQGLFMPGSRLPIVGSETLTSASVQHCLLAVNPDIEAKVIQKNTDFTDQGGQFHSIFPASAMAFFFDNEKG